MVHIDIMRMNIVHWNKPGNIDQFYVEKFTVSTWWFKFKQNETKLGRHDP